MLKNVIKIIRGITISIILLSLVIVMTQDIQIAPQALWSITENTERDISTIPADTTGTFVETKDGERLEIWRAGLKDNAAKKPYVAIIYHGNGGTVDKFYFLQEWFQEMGIVSYGFDYRGFGKSSGWPSESGFYADSDVVWDYVLAHEQVEASQIIVVGYSLGGAMAARVASIHQPKLLILIAAFSSVDAVVRERSVIEYLAPFVWYDLPTDDYVAALQDTDLLITHGRRDRIVSFSHFERLVQAFGGQGSLKTVVSDESGHNDLFFDKKSELTQSVRALLAEK